MAPRSNRSAVSLGFKVCSFRRGGCAGGAEQQFGQGLNQLLVLAGRERQGGRVQQGKVELGEWRFRLRLHCGPPWAVASAKAYGIPGTRARRSASRAVGVVRWGGSAAAP